MWHVDRDAYSSGHLVLSHLGFAYILLAETNRFPELVVIFRSILVEYPSVLSRFFIIPLAYLFREKVKATKPMYIITMITIHHDTAYKSKRPLFLYVISSSNSHERPEKLMFVKIKKYNFICTFWWLHLTN